MSCNSRISRFQYPIVLIVNFFFHSSIKGLFWVCFAFQTLKETLLFDYSLSLQTILGGSSTTHWPEVGNFWSTTLFGIQLAQIEFCFLCACPCRFIYTQACSRELQLRATPLFSAFEFYSVCSALHIFWF